MIRLVGPLNSGVAVGSAGSATANADTTAIVTGRVRAIYIKYNHSPPAGTTDVVIATKGTSPSPPTRALLTITNAATDAWFYPVVQADDTVGAAITDAYTAIAVYDLVNVKIDDADAGDSVDVWILLEE